jgi:hypothetical protein
MLLPQNVTVTAAYTAHKQVVVSNAVVSTPLGKAPMKMQRCQQVQVQAAVHHPMQYKGFSGQKQTFVLQTQLANSSTLCHAV